MLAETHFSIFLNNKLFDVECGMCGGNSRRPSTQKPASLFLSLNFHFRLFILLKKHIFFNTMKKFLYFNAILRKHKATLE